MERNIVVTGGAGFIGSSLVEELLKENNVTVIDNLFTGKMKNISDFMNHENFKFYRADILDLEFLKKILEDTDYIFHLAAIPSVKRSMENPEATNEVNIKGTLNVLRAATNSSVKKLIFASSSSVYGDSKILPKKEDFPPNPKSFYAVSKLVGELYCKIFNDLYGLRTVCLRYFNVYGPKQDFKSDYAAVIPKFIKHILENKKLVIYGDGSQTRDFTFVKDVVNANILAMKKNNITGVFNIARGNNISINEIAMLISEYLNKNIEIVYADPRSGDVKHSLADIQRAKKYLGYMPQYSIKKGLKVTIEWYLSHL